MTATYGKRTLEAAAALSQRPGGSRLSEIAETLRVRMSSAQRAIQSLTDEGMVTAIAQGPDRRYVINRGHPASDALGEFALRKLSVREALDIVVRANAAVEFAGRDERGYVVVLSPFAEPADVARLQETFELINRARPDRVVVDMFERSELRNRLFDEPDLRERGLGMRPVKGSAIRMFRDPHRHGSFDAPKLGRLHPSLPRVPRRAITRLAKEHGLARIAVFGSAVRSDFRPDSDVDVLVEAKPGARLGVGNLVALKQEMEDLLDRDVNVLTPRAVNGRMGERVARDQVVLHGRA